MKLKFICRDLNLIGKGILLRDDINAKPVNLEKDILENKFFFAINICGVIILLMYEAALVKKK